MNRIAAHAICFAAMLSSGAVLAAQPWTDKPIKNDPDNFQFAVVSDRGGGVRPGVFAEMIEKLNILQPEFVMCVGDLIEGYTEDPAELKAMRDELEGIVNRLDARFYYVPGNHDVGNEFMIRDWEKRYGTRHYSFTYRDVLFVALNSQDPPEHRIGNAQIAWLKGELAKNPNSRWTFIFLHTPLWRYRPDQNGWAEIEPLLKGRKHTIFAGHTHNYAKVAKGLGTYITLATTGGGSKLTGRKDGEFDQAAWVTMTPEGPKVANLLIEGVLDENLKESIVSVYRRLKESIEVTINSIMIEGPDPKELEAAAKLTNLGDTPVIVELKWCDHPDFRVRPQKTLKTVKPKSVEHARFRLRSARPVDVNDFPGVYVDYRAVLDEKGIPETDVEGRLAFGFDRRHECPRAQGPVAVDGDLKDWTDLEFVVKNPREVGMVAGTWNGPEDGWFRFGTRHDGDYVYFAVEAHDDAETRKNREYYQRDGVFIAVDPRGEEERIAAWEKQDPGNPIIYGQTPEGEMPDYYKVTLPEGAKWACVPSPDGWTAELAIPRRVFKAEGFRLNVAQIDTDGGEEWGSMPSWRPGWGSVSDHFLESGWFVFK